MQGRRNRIIGEVNVNEQPLPQDDTSNNKGKTIFMISGLSDVAIVGNQSMKNGLTFLSRFGYRIKVFTFMPRDYSNLQDPKEIFDSNVEFHRLGALLSQVLNIGKRFKDVIGRRSAVESQQGEPNELSGTYIKEYSPVGRIIYMGFLFLFYLPIEVLRVLIYSVQCRPDLVYGLNCQGSVAASLIGRLLNKPVVTRFHGISLTEHDLAYSRSKLLLLDEIAGLKAKTDGVIVTNDGTKGDKILRMLGVEENKIHFWMNGLDMDDLVLPENWSRESFKKELGIEGKKIILMVSRLSPWKRVDRGIRCVQKLVYEHRLKDILLFIAGEGPEREKLEGLAGQLGTTESVRFLGSVSHKEIAKYFSIADTFLSLYDVSNLGNPVLEALYFGLPIVTIDEEGLESLLNDGFNAALIPIEKIETELALRVKQLLEDESLRGQMGINGEKTFKKKVLSWEERMRLEDHLIRSVISVR